MIRQDRDCGWRSWTCHQASHPCQRITPTLLLYTNQSTMRSSRFKYVPTWPPKNNQSKTDVSYHFNANRGRPAQLRNTWSAHESSRPWSRRGWRCILRWEKRCRRPGPTCSPSSTSCTRSSSWTCNFTSQANIISRLQNYTILLLMNASSVLADYGMDDGQSSSSAYLWQLWIPSLLSSRPDNFWVEWKQGHGSAVFRILLQAFSSL